MVEFISLAVGIYQQLENGSEPAHFPENMLPIFKQFKNAYDSKDSDRVCITLKPEGEYRIWQVLRIDSI